MRNGAGVRKNGRLARMSAAVGPGGGGGGGGAGGGGEAGGGEGGCDGRLHGPAAAAEELWGEVLGAHPGEVGLDAAGRIAAGGTCVVGGGPVRVQAERSLRR